MFPGPGAAGFPAWWNTDRRSARAGIGQVLVQNADGLESASDIGGGIHHVQYLLDTYPDSVLQVGLWMVDAFEGIVTGTYDHNIDILIAWMKKAHRPVFLRIGYEFDFPGIHYVPQIYRQAFQYIVNRFRAAKVETVAFV